MAPRALSLPPRVLLRVGFSLLIFVGSFFGGIVISWPGVPGMKPTLFCIRAVKCATIPLATRMMFV